LFLIGALVPGDQFALGSTIVGTYGFMAPEQFRGAATPSSDLYSLGATLLYLVSGRPPGAFPQKRMRLVYEDKVSMGPQLKELLDGLLEPQVRRFSCQQGRSKHVVDWRFSGVATISWAS
jgi:serine/threonine protein kinase